MEEERTIWGYVRVSTKKQNADIQTEIVRKLVDEIAEDEEIINKKIIIDHASGSNLNRPGMSIMLNGIKEKDIVIASCLDRLSRNIYDIDYLTKFFREKKVWVEFVSEIQKMSMMMAIMTPEMDKQRLNLSEILLKIQTSELAK